MEADIVSKVLHTRFYQYFLDQSEASLPFLYGETPQSPSEILPQVWVVQHTVTFQ